MAEHLHTPMETQITGSTELRILPASYTEIRKINIQRSTEVEMAIICWEEEPPNRFSFDLFTL